MTQSDELLREREWVRVTLASIGDAVITTDTAGRVVFLNPSAQALTGWSDEDASGMPLDAVFNIVNEETRETVESPAVRALREGLVVGLANHTLLVAKDGSERPIDDSAAPIRDASGAVVGVVLVFRDVTERRNAERALQESEERFRLLVEGVEDYAIFRLDPQGIVTSWNPGAARIYGVEAHEILGRHFSCFYPPQVAAGGYPQHELKIAAEKGRFEDEGWRVRKDGSRFWANAVIAALRDQTSALRGFAKVTRDLTEQRMADEALRAREARLQALTRTANDAIISADAGGRIIHWNPAAAAIFGYAQDEALGQPITMLMPERYREAHLAGFRRLQKTGESRLIGTTVELAGCRSDGSEFPIEISLATWNTAEGQFFTGIIRDITRRKQNEEAMRQMHRAQVQAEALADLNRRKDEFLAMLSHELRNPLSPIINALHLLRLGHSDLAIREQATAIIERQTEKLTRLIDDLLDVSRISTGRISLARQRVDLRAIVERAVETIRPLIDQRRHELAVSLPAEPIWLEADPIRIEQVVVNLLSNAAKYTDEGGQVRLSARHEGDEAVLRVVDTGVGIAPDLLGVVFDLFTQAERSLDRRQGGLGIGLTVARRVVEMHGGRIEATSAGPGRGSEFVVWLPLGPPGETTQRAAPSGEAQRAARSLRVLVVEDNKDAADSLATLLRHAGHEVQVSYSGQTAMVAALEFHPHAVILDIGLPVVDGYEVARRFREKPELGNVRLIALTGYGTEADKQRCIEAGFDVHMVKPIRPAQIQDALADLG